MGKTSAGARDGVAGFLGSYLHQLDSKGRLSLPAAFRRDYEGDAYVLIQAHPDALSLYPRSSWSEVEGRLQDLVKRRPDARHYLLGLTANAHHVSPDRQGRILIPDRLRTGASLDGEALVVGALDKIEIWNPELFEEKTGAGDEPFSDLAASIFA